MAVGAAETANAARIAAETEAGFLSRQLAAEVDRSARSEADDGATAPHEPPSEDILTPLRSSLADPLLLLRSPNRSHLSPQGSAVGLLRGAAAAAAAARSFNASPTGLKPAHDGVDAVAGSADAAEMRELLAAALAQARAPVLLARFL